MAFYTSLQLRPSSSSTTATLPFSKSSSSSFTCRASISFPKQLPYAVRISLPKIPSITATTPHPHLNLSNHRPTSPLVTDLPTPTTSPPTTHQAIYNAVLEAVADRIQMHTNVAIQRDNWNSLLLTSINMSILAATTMTAVSADTVPSAIGSTILFSTSTALLLIMNAIQPSQLAEEQRNATRLFKKLESQLLHTVVPTQAHVEEAVEKVLALDRAYPLPLLGGKMIPKFPSQFEPSVWWPKQQVTQNDAVSTTKYKNNGWTDELESEMKQVLRVVRAQDKEDYVKLGNMALKVNKVLAVSGPALTGIAAAASAAGLVGVAVAAGAMAAAVNTLEHGGQIGMVVEMYRSCAGFFDHLEGSIESNLEESDLEKRENGDLFEMKVGLALGRSPSQVRELASKCSYSEDEGTPLDEFASKLF
ncbi:Probable F-box protein At4g22030 [Linum perenne]